MADRPKRKRIRDYAAEYQRRVAKGLAEGKSREEAAGHGKRRRARGWRRFWDWLTKPRDTEPEPGPVIGDGGRKPPPPPKAPPLPPPPEDDDGSEGPEWERVPPGESGIPPDEQDLTTYEQLAHDLGIWGDAFAMDLLWVGWFADVSTDQRRDARNLFYYYTGLNRGTFGRDNWANWRDWYQATVAA